MQRFIHQHGKTNALLPLQTNHPRLSRLGVSGFLLALTGAVGTVRAGTLPKTTFIPIDDGNTNTSEYGYAGDPTGNDQINGVAFIRSGLITVNNQQFIAYYYRHATNSGDTNNNRIVIARRDIGTNIWAVFHTTVHRQ